MLSALARWRRRQALEFILALNLHIGRCVDLDLCSGTQFTHTRHLDIRTIYAGTKMLYTDVTAFNDGEAIACAREQIDKEIDTLTILIESARALKTRRNTLSLISRLPPEVISEFFVFVTVGADQMMFNMDCIRAISHVYKHWRNVALACPTSWVHVFLSQPTAPAWLEELLKRSKTVPLVIRMSHNISPKAYESYMQHTSRMCELHVKAPESLKRLLAARSPIYVPLLETLCLNYTSLGDIL